VAHSLTQLIQRIDRLTPVRRALVAALCEGHPESGPAGAGSGRNVAAAHGAEAGLAELEHWLCGLPGEGSRRDLRVGDRVVPVDVSYELEEIRRDLLLLRSGEASVHERLREQWPTLEGEVDEVRRVLRGQRYQALFTDRDGTIVRYAPRYATSHQSASAALPVLRFASTRAATTVVLSSGPLSGLERLSAFPAGTVTLAGSKGREYADASGERGHAPVAPRDAGLLAELGRRIADALERPDWRLFSQIGSGFQEKLGQLTVSRQDITGTASSEESAALLRFVQETVGGLDPAGTRLRVIDTGLDVEISLTSPEDGERDYDKGDGIAYLSGELGLSLDGAAVLVCGDTESDLAMLRELRRSGADPTAVFVTADRALRERVRAAAPRWAFCTTPDALVTAMGREADE
jgi:hypothetical protein